MNQPTDGFSAKGALYEGVLISAALDAIITVDVDGKILGFNPAAEQMFGHKEVNTRGVNFADVMFPAHLHDRHQEAIEGLLESGDTAIRRCGRSGSKPKA
jgi:PAS domain S-box-containing protein